ncbi:FAD-dependent oxidoreductase [Pendulispora albinea]|uniref:FAD-dependent oxidoreductase n=1 Tax=Pendulispora albinea TaxID=2741071 RepID=A0ABZ2LU92_9BACT
MGGGDQKLTGPDLAQGIEATDLTEGVMLVGHAHGEAVLVARKGTEVFAVGATCTHYGGPLAEGLLVDDTVRCPWHHACFSLRSGEALRAPALNALPCFEVDQRDGKVFVLGKRPPQTKRAPAAAPESIVIVGAGAAGNAAAEMLRREGYVGKVTMVGDDPALPCDRPNLSKDYLAGTAPEEWIPLRAPEFYEDKRIELRLGVRVDRIEPSTQKMVFADGTRLGYGALLLATGAEPVRLEIPGADLPHVHYLRTLAQSRAIIARAERAKRAVVLGASFIGLEVAASLRARGLEVAVVAPEARPLERVMGPELGDFLRSFHEEHGVVFHLGQTATRIDPERVVLASGESLEADLVVAGIGVRPNVQLAEAAGLAVDRGVAVNEYLQTSVPGIWAAGDIARWPDPHTGQKIRVEHWVVAERQGQIAAINMLGGRTLCDLTPFFWSQHYDLPIAYVGHAEKWDRIDVSGSLAARDATFAFRAGEKTLAVVTVGRDRQSLEAELAFERRDARVLAGL